MIVIRVTKSGKKNSAPYVGIEHSSESIELRLHGHVDVFTDFLTGDNVCLRDLLKDWEVLKELQGRLTQ